MYGYDPPKQPDEGSWRETLSFVLMTFRVLLPIFLVILGVMGGLIITILVGFHDARLTLIPIGVCAVALVWYLRRERRKAEEEQERLVGHE